MVKDEDWKLVYIDDFMVVFTKEGNLAKIDLSKLDPGDFKFDTHVSYLRLGIFLLKTQNQNGARFIQKAAQIFPNSPIITQTSNPFFW